MTIQSNVKLFVVDAHQLFIEDIKSLAHSSGQFEACGESFCLKKALEKITCWKPDILLADIGSLAIADFEFIKEIKQQFPQIKTLLLLSSPTIYNHEKRHMIDGCILKNCNKEELFNALKKSLKAKNISPAI